jgi:serine/threonine protein kinase
VQVTSFKNANKGLLLLQIAHDVAAGLAYLHPAVVHRDLKPQNILLEGGPAGRAKVNSGNAT